jgi:hypothetical protein
MFTKYCLPVLCWVKKYASKIKLAEGLEVGYPLKFLGIKYRHYKSKAESLVCDCVYDLDCGISADIR